MNRKKTNGIKIFLNEVLSVLFNRIDFNRVYERRILFASKLYHKGGKINQGLAILFHTYYRNIYPSEIYPQVTFEGDVHIPHCVGIVIGKTSIIGHSTTIMPNVVIGARYSPNHENNKGRRHAKIGANCFLGANSTIIGDITIGDNVTIGAGAVVTRDIPSCSIVTGINNIREKKE
jgi:serine acetyltransferase